MFDLNIVQQNHYFHLYIEHMYQNNKYAKKSVPNIKYKIVKKLFSINKKKSFVLKY